MCKYKKHSAGKMLKLYAFLYLAHTKKAAPTSEILIFIIVIALKRDIS